MNLLIGFVILVCLVGSEIQTAEIASDLWMRMLMVGLVSLTVPGLALFQTRIVSQRFQTGQLSDAERDSALRRLSVCHSAVWLTASLAIIWAVRWQDIVRGNWNLDRWPLLDEILIIAPVILSLIASWAIFFEIEHAASPRRNGFDLEKFKRRIEFVSIRVRVYCLMVMIPVSIVVLARDLAPWIDSLTLISQLTLGTCVVLALVAGFPFLLLMIWKNDSIPDVSLRTELLEECQRNRLFVYDVRQWNTGGQIANAVVAGLLPRLRVMLLSDRLIQRFSKRELLAIVRHEAGHLKLCHLPIRIGFGVLPLIALSIDEQNSSGLLSVLDVRLSQLGLPLGTGIGLVCVAYVTYLFLVLPWLSRQMEFEADIYACQERTNESVKASLNPEFAQDMTDALLRLAALAPSQYRRNTLLHPSIESRTRMLQVIEESPVKAQEFCRAFKRRRRIVLGMLITACLITLAC